MRFQDPMQERIDGYCAEIIALIRKKYMAPDTDWSLNYYDGGNLRPLDDNETIFQARPRATERINLSLMKGNIDFAYSSDLPDYSSFFRHCYSETMANLPQDLPFLEAMVDFRVESEKITKFVELGYFDAAAKAAERDYLKYWANRHKHIDSFEDYIDAAAEAEELEYYGSWEYIDSFGRDDDEFDDGGDAWSDFNSIMIDYVTDNVYSPLQAEVDTIIKRVWKQKYEPRYQNYLARRRQGRTTMQVEAKRAANAYHSQLRNLKQSLPSELRPFLAPLMNLSILGYVRFDGNREWLSEFQRSYALSEFQRSYALSEYHRRYALKKIRQARQDISMYLYFNYPQLLRVFAVMPSAEDNDLSDDNVFSDFPPEFLNNGDKYKQASYYFEVHLGNMLQFGWHLPYPQSWLPKLTDLPQAKYNLNDKCSNLFGFGNEANEQELLIALGTDLLMPITALVPHEQITDQLKQELAKRNIINSPSDER